MTPDIKNPTVLDWVRLAAFIDGEGSIFLRNEDVRGVRRTYLYVDVSNTDTRLISWLKETFGGSVCSMAFRGRPERWTPCFQWRVSHLQATRILEGCFPYFIVKKEQAELALAHQKLVSQIKSVPIRERTAMADLFQEERQGMRIQLSKMKSAGRVHLEKTAATVQ